MSVKENDPSGAEKVVSAAIDEFSEYGFDGARVDRIAKNSSLNKAMIYYYYSSKEKLYEAVLSLLYKKVSTAVNSQIATEGDIVTRLGRIVDFYADLLLNLDAKLLRIMMKEIASGGKFLRKFFIPLMVPIQRELVRLIDEGVQRGELREGYHTHTLIQVVGSVVFFSMLSISAKGTDLEKVLLPENYREVFKQTLKTNLLEGVLPRMKQSSESSGENL